MRYLAAITAAAMIAATPAIAADLGKGSKMAPATAAEYGPERRARCHVAGMMGFGIASAQLADGSEKLPLAATGTLAGVGAGCDMAFGKIVVGGFGSYDFGEAKAKVAIGDGGGEVDLSGIWTIGARLGYMIQTNTMLYGALGYTGAKVKGFGDTEQLRGLALGGGMETKIVGDLWFRTEAMWHMYGKEGVDSTAKIDTTLTTVKAGMAWKF